MKGKNPLLIAIIFLVLGFGALTYWALTKLDFELFSKTGSFKACTEYTYDSCPDGCSVCPPCQTCSSLQCQSKKACLDMGFDDIYDGDGNGTDTDCGIENCHGLDIQCGPDEAEVCTEIYEMGDKCRQYAECGVVDGQCQQIESEEFTTCKTCIEGCIEEFGQDTEGLWECEGECE